MNTFFLIASIPLYVLTVKKVLTYTADYEFLSDIVNICIFAFIELCFGLDAASWFALADGKAEVAAALMKAGGAFGFLAGLCGYYAVAHGLCADALPFSLPMGDTSRYFQKRAKKND